MNRNLYTGLIVCPILLSAVLGCGVVQRLTKSGSDKTNANKTIADKTIDTAVGEEKTGVPECDQVIDALAAEANNPDDGYITKAVKATILNRIKSSLRENIEKNKNDTAEMARQCSDFYAQLQKYKAEETNRNSSKTK